MECKRAAILAAGLAGYSRMMAQNGRATLDAISSLRHGTIDPIVARYCGRVLKTTDDGLLIEFQSAVAAVECALAWQDGSRSAQKGLDENRQLQFRIGVDHDEIVAEGEELFGDSVNAATGAGEDGGTRNGLHIGRYFPTGPGQSLCRI